MWYNCSVVPIQSCPESCCRGPHMARRALYSACLFLLAAEMCCWPHFLLENDCEKGLALVGGASHLPRIMNVIPTEDPTIIEVYRRGVDECDRALNHGDVVIAGDVIDLVYAGTILPDTHTTFVTSSGELRGGQSCGGGGGSLLCSSCGEGWVKRAAWMPTTPGVAQVAVGFAHGNYGTPAVTVGIITLHVAVANETTLDRDEEDFRRTESDTRSTECGMLCRVEQLAAALEQLAAALCDRYVRLLGTL